MVEIGYCICLQPDQRAHKLPCLLYSVNDYCFEYELNMKSHPYSYEAHYCALTICFYFLCITTSQFRREIIGLTWFLKKLICFAASNLVVLVFPLYHWWTRSYLYVCLVILWQPSKVLVLVFFCVSCMPLCPYYLHPAQSPCSFSFYNSLNCNKTVAISTNFEFVTVTQLKTFLLNLKKN